MSRLALAALVLLAAGCDNTDEDDTLRVDLAVGSQSSYAITLSDVEDGVETITTNGDATLSVVGRDETVTGQPSNGGNDRTASGLTRVYLQQRLTTNAENVSGGATTWYREQDDRLEELASASAGGFAPAVGLKTGRSAVRPAWALGGPALPSANAGAGKDSTTTFRPSPRVVVDYAAADGGVWEHFEVDGLFTSRRRRVGVREVNTAAGPFECVEIETTYTEDVGVAWTDCVGAPGLVTREIRYTGPSTTEDGGTGVSEVVERWTLTAYTPGGVVAKR